jgi:hypothetical protein
VLTPTSTALLQLKVLRVQLSKKVLCGSTKTWEIKRSSTKYVAVVLCFLISRQTAAHREVL